MSALSRCSSRESVMNRIRYCVQCRKCRLRYVVAASPYGNGSCRVGNAAAGDEEYLLYCSCCTPPACTRLNASDVMRCAVSSEAYNRGYGTAEEIVLARRISMRARSLHMQSDKS